MASLTKQWAAKWLSNGNTSVAPVYFTPVVREVITEFTGRYYTSLIEFTDGIIVEEVSWRVPRIDNGMTLDECLAVIKQTNLDAWRERSARRRNPVGCYGRDMLDELVGL